MHAPFHPSFTCLSFAPGTSCTLTKCGAPSVLLHHTSRTPYLQPPGPFARREISLTRFCPSASERLESSSLFVALCVFPIHPWSVLLVVVVSAFPLFPSSSSLSSRRPPVGPDELLCNFGGA